MVISTLPASERPGVMALLAPRWPLLLLGWLFGAGAITLAARALWSRHVTPVGRLAEQVNAWRASAVPQALALPGTPALDDMALACNDLLAQRQLAYAERDAEVARAGAELARERNRLASLLVQSAQALVVCNRDGAMLLYNARARLQLRALSHAPSVADGAELVGIGRSIYSVFDRAQIEHALERVQQRLHRGSAHAAAQIMTTTHSGRLLRVQLTPVLDEVAGKSDSGLSGFMLTLDDVTRDFDAAAERDRWLGQATSQISAAVQVLSGAVTDLSAATPGGDGASRALARVHDQCATLRQHSAELVRHAAEGVATRWPMEDMLAADLLAAAQHRLAQESLPRLAVESPPTEVWLRVDSYLLLEALAAVAERLVDAFTPRFLGLRVQVAEQEGSAQLDLFWDGQSFSTETVMGWELEPVGTSARRGVLTLREVLDRHRGQLAFGRDRLRNESFLRFVLPLPATTEQAEPSAPAAPLYQDGRPEFYDFDLFQVRPFQGALDDEPLSTLAYTVFDTETTGLNPSQGDQVVQIGATRIVNGRLLRSESFEQLVDPGRPVSAANTAVHGITNAMLQGQPKIAEVLPAFHAFAQGTVLVAHNAAFDMKFLQLQEKATGLVFDQPVLDTLLLALVVQPKQSSHRLDALTERFGIAVEGRHTALADARATAEVLLRLIPLLEAQGIRTLGQARAASQQTQLARLKY
jgi:DNA polymerase-3 subunit epsilon